MKPYLIVTQLLYAVSLVFWFIVWSMSFMVFDQGFALWNTMFFIGVSAYPVAVAGSSAAAWIMHKRYRRAAVIVNLTPLIWVAGAIVFVIYTS